MLTIDDPETERIVRELAARRGQSIDAVVRNAVLAQTPATEPTQASPDEQSRRHAILLEIARRMDALPDLDTRTADEVIGYDESGLPT